MRFRNRYTTNNVNVCVNVIKSGDHEYDEDISQLKNNVNSLTNNVNTIMSDEFFKIKFNQFLSDSEIEKIQSLVSKYDEINELLSSASKIQYKETIIHFVQYGENENSNIQAIIDNEWISLNDAENTDNDADTVYKLPIKGFIVGVELYTSSEGTIRERFEGLKTSYDTENDITTIFMNKDDYDFVYERYPNNKIYVYSLIIK